MKRHLKAAAGFTLVELIVVIAILGTLSAVAVPTYSGYVKKANMASDQSLFNDIESALTLAHYSQSLPDAEGMVLLSKDQPAVAIGENVDQAMENVFGTGWAETLKVKYDGWTVDSDVVDAALALSDEQAEAVMNSNYLTNSSVGNLLDKVQYVTSAAAEFLGDISGKTPEGYLQALQDNLGDGYMTAAKQAGLVTESGEMAGEAFKDGKMTAEAQNQFSNLMVMSVAKEMEGMTDDELMGTLANLKDPTGSYTGTGSIGNQMAVTYSMILAYELSNGEEPSEAFNTMNTGLNSNSLSAVMGAMTTYLNDNTTGFANYLVDLEAGGISDAAKTDFKALTSIMSGVNAVSDKYTDADKLADGNLMTSGAIANDVNAFVGTVAAKDSITDDQIAMLSAGKCAMITYRQIDENNFEVIYPTEGR